VGRINVRKKEYTAMFEFFFYWKMTISTSQSLSDLLCLFSVHNISDSGYSGWQEIFPCQPWESIDNDASFHGCWGEPCLIQLSILNRYDNFKCTLRQGRKLFAQSTSEFRRVTAARYECGIKHWLTLTINQFIFKKHFERTSPFPAKFHTFSFMLQNCLSILEGLNLPGHVDKEHKG